MVSKAIARMVLGIDYANFKESLGDSGDFGFKWCCLGVYEAVERCAFGDGQ